MFGEQKVNGLAIFVDSAVEIAPLTLDLDVRLVHAPADIHRPLAAMERLFELWAVFDYPAVDCRMIHVDPTFEHQFFDMTCAQRVRYIPADSHQNDLWGEMRPFETDRHCLAPS